MLCLHSFNLTMGCDYNMPGHHVLLSCSIPRRMRSWCGTLTTNKLSTSSFPSIPVRVLSVSATQCASLPPVERSALSSLVYTDQTCDNLFVCTRCMCTAKLYIHTSISCFVHALMLLMRSSFYDFICMNNISAQA